MVGEFRTCHLLPEKTPLEETCIDLAIPCICKMLSQRVRLIKRGDGRHHVNDGLCAEPGNGSAPIVLKVVSDAAKERPQQFAFLSEMFWPGRVWTCDGDMTECLSRMFGIAHSISLAACQKPRWLSETEPLSSEILRRAARIGRL